MSDTVMMGIASELASDDRRAGLVGELGLPFMAALPIPLYWRVLVLPREAEQVSKGGIVLADDTRTAQQYQCYVGRILATGGEAFQSERFRREKRLPGIGDWVAYGRYAGQRMEYLGKLLLIVNDDELLTVVPDPTTLRIYV